jgi:hypothetical protein
MGGTCDSTSGVTSGSTYCLPGGDLGIWEATETGTGEACASTKMNALVGDVAERVNTSLKLLAAVVCVAKVEGRAQPDKGASLDLTSSVSAAYTGATVTAAKIERESSDTTAGNAIYKLTFAGTISSTPVSITLRHAPSSTGEDFSGRLNGTVAITGGGASSQEGFSVVYSQSGSSVSYVLKSGQTPTSSTTSLFDSSGNYLFSAFTSITGAGNGKYLIASVNKTSGLGTVKFAWQAGQNDSKTRVFHANTTAGTSADSGFAYFGFGPKIDSVNVGNIGGMCCNWAGPGGVCMGSSYDLADKAQSQVMSRNSSGLFVPSSSSITYAPTNSCNHSTATTFKYAPPGTGTGKWGADGSSISAAAVTNNLTSLTAAGTMPTVTEPTF